jgi:hypothetical protein
MSEVDGVQVTMGPVALPREPDLDALVEGVCIEPIGIGTVSDAQPSDLWTP